MTFEEFWKWRLEDETFYDTDEPVAREAWEAATLAERKRLEKFISVDYKFFKENYSELPGEVGQYYGGRLDSYEEVLDAVRNP